MEKYFLGFCLMFLSLTGCGTMEITDFKNGSPPLVLEDYFAGKTRAWGIFEDRFGNLRRQFTVNIDGKWNGKTLVLDEQFVYRDGEKDRRIWTIEKIDKNHYQGRADDVIGVALGNAKGNALNWRYDMNLKVGETRLRVHFNDWMFLQSDNILVNRARVTKWGVELGQVTLFFSKPTTTTQRKSAKKIPIEVNVLQRDGERLKAANQ
jgi:hypothetical protein